MRENQCMLENKGLKQIRGLFVYLPNLLSTLLKKTKQKKLMWQKYPKDIKINSFHVRTRNSWLRLKHPKWNRKRNKEIIMKIFTIFSANPFIYD